MEGHLRVRPQPRPLPAVQAASPALAPWLLLSVVPEGRTQLTPLLRLLLDMFPPPRTPRLLPLPMPRRRSLWWMTWSA